MAKKVWIKNYFYFVAGILGILFSFTHALNGKTAVLPLFEKANHDLSLSITFFYFWHIITSENLIFAIAFLIMAFYKDLSQVKFTAWIISAIMIFRFFVIIGSTLLKDPTAFTSNLVDSIAITIYTGLIILETRVKDKI
jgi:hypothetical protein